MKTAEEVLTALLNVQLKPGGTLKKDLVNAKLAKDEQIKILTEWGKELCEEQFDNDKESVEQDAAFYELPEDRDILYIRKSNIKFTLPEILKDK